MVIIIIIYTNIHIHIYTHTIIIIREGGRRASDLSKCSGKGCSDTTAMSHNQPSGFVVDRGGWDRERVRESERERDEDCDGSAYLNRERDTTQRALGRRGWAENVSTD